MDKNSKLTVWKVFLAVALVSVVGIGTALVQENENADEQIAPDVEYTWTAPTTGTPVDHYVAEVLVNEIDSYLIDPVHGESIMLPVQYGNKYQIRVAGVDAANIQGPMSIWSLPYTPELGPPEF